MIMDVVEKKFEKYMLKRLSNEFEFSNLEGDILSFKNFNIKITYELKYSVININIIIERKRCRGWQVYNSNTQLITYINSGDTATFPYWID